MDYLQIECAKLRASRAFFHHAPHVPYGPTCLTCSRALRACVPSCLYSVRAFIFYVPLLFLLALIFLRILRAFTFLRVLCAFIFLLALRTLNFLLA